MGTSRPDGKRKPGASGPAPDTRPRPWMRGAGVRWIPCPYVHGDGARLITADWWFELVPYVTAPGGIVAGYAIELDGTRNGFIRVPGPLEQAQAVAELMLTDQVKAKG